MSPLSFLLNLALLTFTSAAPFPLSPTPALKPRTTSPGYGTLSLTTNGPIIHAVIDNPPVNLWDYKLAHDFSSFLSSLKTTNTTTKVVTISSANPSFWIAHYDIHVLVAADPVKPPANATLIGQQLISSRTLLSTLPVIFIAQINGRVTGAGDELAVQCDIRYAGPGARLSQFEVGFGLLPGAGGVQYLVKLIGRARALEFILSARSVDAVTAAAIGWVNKAFGSSEELGREVEALAERIAVFPQQALAAIKARVNAQRPSEEDLDEDLELFGQLVDTDVAQAAGQKFLQLSGEESKGAFELDVPGDIDQISS
ncbi:MAG: hypothetical protein Q9195_000443 [Heterodermia aff. obscurata]